MRVVDEIEIAPPDDAYPLDETLDPAISMRAPELKAFAISRLQALISDSETPPRVKLGAIQELACWLRLSSPPPTPTTTHRRSIEINSPKAAMALLRGELPEEEGD